MSSSSRMMWVCGMPGKNVRQIRWVMPYASTNRLIAATQYSDRRVRPLHGRGLEPPLDRVVAALEADAPVRPEPRHDPELLLEPGPALLELDPVERELVRLVADRDPERDPAVRHHVEQRHVLGEADGMVEGRDEDVGAERDSGRPRREPGEHRQG